MRDLMASAVVWLEPKLFWVFTERWLVVLNGRFGAVYRSYFRKQPSWTAPPFMMRSKISAETSLTLILLTRKIWWAPNNASKRQVGCNLAFKGLNKYQPTRCINPEAWSSPLFSCKTPQLYNNQYSTTRRQLYAGNDLRCHQRQIYLLHGAESFLSS